MGQFLGPETDVMGERYFIKKPIGHSIMKMSNISNKYMVVG